MNTSDKLMSYWLSLMGLVYGAGYVAELVSSLNVRWATLDIVRSAALTFPASYMNAGENGTSSTLIMPGISMMVWGSESTPKCSNTSTSAENKRCTIMLRIL